MSTSGTTTTGLRPSKRLKRRNIVKVKIGYSEFDIDEDDYNIVFNTFPDLDMEEPSASWGDRFNSISCRFEDDTRRICILYADGRDRTDDYELPEDFGRLSALQELHLEQLGLSSIPSSIEMVQNLTELSLSENLLFSPLPDEIGNLKKLTSLDLSGNKLTHLPPSIGDLKNLEYFDLSENELTHLPTIGSLNSLHGLYLSRNPLSSLPTTIGDLENLEDLHLTHTLISSFPASFGNLKSLTSLCIQCNTRLKQFPKELFNLSAIKRLHISGYSALMLELRNLKGLECLCIHGLETSNELSSVQHLQHLNTLHLYGLYKEFGVSQLGVARKLPNLKDLVFVNHYSFGDDEEGSGNFLAAGDLTQDDCQFILDLVRDTSLIHIDPSVEDAIPEISYALACNCFEMKNPFCGHNRNEKMLPFLNKLWPRMLTNSARACMVPNHHWYQKVRMNSHDATYKLLSEGMDSFVQMLLARNRDKAK